MAIFDFSKLLEIMGPYIGSANGGGPDGFRIRSFMAGPQLILNSGVAVDSPIYGTFATDTALPPSGFTADGVGTVKYTGSADRLSLIIISLALNNGSAGTNVIVSAVPSIGPLPSVSINPIDNARVLGYVSGTRWAPFTMRFLHTLAPGDNISVAAANYTNGDNLNAEGCRIEVY